MEDEQIIDNKKTMPQLDLTYELVLLQVKLVTAELKVSVLKTLIDIAEKELNFDIRKVWYQTMKLMKQIHKDVGLETLRTTYFWCQPILGQDT